MSDVALPKIKVTDAPYLEGSTAAASVSPTTDGGQLARPRSATPSEGASACKFLYAARLVSCSSRGVRRMVPCRGWSFSLWRLC